MASIEYYATGRRKTSTARVFLRPGKGTITVNHREFDKYFTTDALRTVVRRPQFALHADQPVVGRRVATRQRVGRLHVQGARLRFGFG